NDFFFTVDNTLAQCGNFPFSQFDGAKLPLTTFVFIPGGSDSFVIPFSPPPQAQDFNWKANVTAQAEVAISMIDSQGRSGGTDILRYVVGSSDNSCLLKKDSSGSPTPPGPSGSPESQKEDSLSTGAIAGIAIGAALVAGLLAGSLWCLTRGLSKTGRSRRVDAINLNEVLKYPSEYHPRPFPPVFVGSGFEEAHEPLGLPPAYVDLRTAMAGSSPPVGARPKKLG
ncbi:hypothetical protein V5O48_014187, partial [Marasmius crinis-equi]